MKIITTLVSVGLSAAVSSAVFAETVNLSCHFSTDSYGNDEDTTLEFSLREGDERVYGVSLVRSTFDDGDVYASKINNQKVNRDLKYKPKSDINKNMNQYKLVSSNEYCTPNFLIDKNLMKTAPREIAVQLRLQCTDNQGIMMTTCREKL